MFKKISICAAILAFTATQSIAEAASPIGFVNNGVSSELITNSSSTIVVNLEVESERVEVGPYARFAQKYFGVRASLVEKESHTIINADISLAPNDFYVANEKMMTGSSTEIIAEKSERIPIDISSSNIPSVEKSAGDAAKAIFRIRQLRNDLLSGDLGEGFYGSGLAAALERLQWEEDQYTELFFGRTIRSRSNHVLYVTLNGTEPRYIVTRFSNGGKITDITDLTADPLLLQLTPLEPQNIEIPKYTAKSRVAKFWMENQVKCDLFFNSKLLSSKTMPLVEFGQEIIYPITEK
ncbi:MAG: DUF4831 family protein [Rikenellaceae bacterium]